MAKRTILLVDGSSLAFRSFYSILDLERFKNANGLHTNALFSFNRMLDNVLAQFEPTHVLVAFDKGSKTFRTDKYADYKGGRDKAPGEFKEQMPYFPILLDAYGIRQYSLENYEADDIIGTLAHQAETEDEVIVLSGDKDLTQLADEHVTVYITRKGVSELEAYTPASIQETMGIQPRQIIEMKGLMGDSSDNYPGVTRIGEKTALKLIRSYDSVAELYERIDELKPSKMKENLVNEKDIALMSRDLAEIRQDAPVEISLEETKREEKDVEALVDFYREMNFNSFLENLTQEPGLSLPAVEESADLPEYTLQSVDIIETEMLPEKSSLLIEHLLENYHEGTPIGLAWTDPQAHVVYVADFEGALQQDDFRAWLADETKAKVTKDSKAAEVLVHRFGGELNGVSFDVDIASYLLDTHNSDQLADMLKDASLPAFVQYDDIVYGKGAKQAVPETEVLHEHLKTKAMALDLLEAPQIERLKAVEMEDLYRSIELPLSDVLAQMEMIGIKVDGAILQERNELLLERLAEMEEEIYELAGERFNINSPKQLGVILFEKLDLPVIKKTKTGYSTAAGVLEKLVNVHPIIAKIMDYRQVAKLQSTYLSSLPEYIQADGRIHTRFDQTLTQTGRLSSSDPNLQNIPTRLEEGRKIRQAFIPTEPDWQFFGADYSQIELRVLAHISQDEHMLQAFRDGEDIHETTARRVFNLPEAEVVTKDMRRQAKAVNFGIVYGISDYGLSQNLNIPRKDAKEFIETYFAKFPGVAKYMEEIVALAKEQGYVSTLFQRRRYLPDIKASNFNVRSFAERTAMNSPIQGTAADIIKLAMIRLQEALDEQDLRSRILLQVHDELILEGPAEEMEILSELVPKVMESAADLDVPLLVEYDQGNTWYDI